MLVRAQNKHTNSERMTIEIEIDHLFELFSSSNYHALEHFALSLRIGVSVVHWIHAVFDLSLSWSKCDEKKRK